MIFEPTGLRVDERAFARSEPMNVAGMRMQVLAVEDALVTKLLALGEHNLDLEPLVAIGRALREQVDWDQVRKRTSHSPFAHAYLSLIERMGLIAPAGAASVGSRVRVLNAPPEVEP